jgi:glucose/arabinose dehydrogenase
MSSPLGLVGQLTHRLINLGKRPARKKSAHGESSHAHERRSTPAQFIFETLESRLLLAADPLGITAGYAFDEVSGTTAADASGHGIVGTLTNGPTFTAGKYGNAVTLDGVNDFVNLGNPTALQFTGSMTVSAWVYVTSFPADDAAVVSKRTAGEVGYQLDVTKDTGPRTIGFKLTNGSGGAMFRYGATTLQPNTWYHIAGVYNAAAQTLDVYLNGVLDNGQLLGTVTSSQQNSTANVNIGARPGTTFFDFAGRIDDVRLADHALTQAQIQTDMATPLGTTPPPPDTTVPNVSLTPPASILAGTVNLAATASDNVGVVGVKFLLDVDTTNTTIGSEDTTSPYGVSWNTTTVSSGTHTLAAQARDAAGNVATTSPITVTVDNQLPTGSVVINGGASATNSRTATLTLDATDAVTSVTQMRFSNNGTSFSTAEVFAPTKTWTLSNGAGTKTVYVQFRDGAGNWSASFNDTIVLDTTAPTISARTTTNITGNSATVTWTTNEPATSQVDYGLTTSYGSTTTLDPNLVTAHTVLLTGLAPGTTYNYRVRSVDAAGNQTVSANSTFTTAAVDTTAPTVQSINRVGATPTNAASVSWTVLFSESVTGVDASDFALVTTGTITGATITSVSGSGNQYTVTAGTGTDNGTLGLNLVDNDTIVDTSANPLAGPGVNGNFTGQIYTVDKLAPSVTINQAASQADPVSTGPINFTVTFSETVTGFAANDISFAGSTVSGALTAVVTGAGQTYNVAVSGMTGNGTVVVSVPAGAATDAAGNASLASTSTDNAVTFSSADTTAPAVTINQAAGQADPTGASPINFTVTFSETVTGFTASDVSFAGSTVSGALTAVVTGSGPTYNVAVSGMTGTGTVVVSVPAGAATDAAGNASLASTSTDNAVTYSSTSGFQNQILATGFDLPTAIKFLPDGRLLVAELTGAIKVLQPPYTTISPTPFLDLDLNIPGYSGLQQGIFDFILDPDFETNHYYYVFYTNDSPNRDRLSRFTANATLDGTVPGSELILYQDPQAPDTEHHGGAVTFGPDGKIYFTTGDHFQGSPSQDLTSPRGKVLRINADGSVPTDNPFYDGAGPNYDAIWALGLRNPYRAYYDAPTGRLLIGDVGGNVASTSIEELNVGVAGANYGWPNVEGTSTNPAFTNPIYSYAHNGRDASITGGFVYHGTQFPSSYQGSYFFADYSQNWIKRLTFDANGNVNGVFNFEPANGAADGPYGDIVYLTEGPDGALYYLDLGYSDTTSEFGISKLRRISYVNSDQPPVVSVSATPTGGPAPLTVTFSSAGSSDPEGHQLTYSWNFGDASPLSTVANPTHTYDVAGPYQVRLTVSDGVNSTISTPLSISVGNVPVIANLQSVVPVNPSNNGLFRAGDVISFSATATDNEDGTLPASAYTWQIDFLHEGHVHPGTPIVGVMSGSFAIPTSGHDFSGNTRYRITLTVKDSDGLQSSQSVLVFPDKVNLTFDTTPGGLTLFLDGIAHTAPFVYDTLIGFSHTIDARNAVVGANTYNFASWSDGGTQSHTIVVPATAQSYTATYNVVSTPAPLAFVQVNAATPQTNQSSVTVTYTSAQVAGDTNILAIGWNDATSNITSVTDSAGNIYQLAVPVARGAGLSQAIYYAKNIKAAAAGTNTVTVTFNTATPFVDLRITEYSGLDPVNPFDVGTSASGTSATANSGSVATSAAHELVFGAGMTTGGFSTAGGGFTSRVITVPDLDIAEDRFVTATGSYSATASLSGSAAWVMQVATFKAAS